MSMKPYIWALSAIILVVVVSRIYAVTHGGCA